MARIKTLPASAIGKPVDVYKNLHNGMWSVRCRKSGKVLGHVEACGLEDVEFVVQPAGRRRVLEEGRKNVHAFARGTLVCDGYPMDMPGEMISYNPYRAGHFYRKVCKTPIRRAPRAALGKWLWAATP